MWNLSFISEQDFTEHVKATIENTERNWSLLILKDSIKTSLTPLS